MLTMAISLTVLSPVLVTQDGFILELPNHRFWSGEDLAQVIISQFGTLRYAMFSKLRSDCRAFTNSQKCPEPLKTSISKDPHLISNVPQYYNYSICMSSVYLIGLTLNLIIMGPSTVSMREATMINKLIKQLFFVWVYVDGTDWFISLTQGIQEKAWFYHQWLLKYSLNVQ